MTDEPISTPDNSQSDSDTDELELTDEQQDALVLDRNVTITAGAGTGKTTTLTHRYLEFLRSNPEATPKNIVTITFTRKAAAELETRVREEVYDELQMADSTEEYNRWRAVLNELDDGYTHTIHAFCARLLRENAVQAPVPMEFDVLDEDDAADLQRQIVVEYVDANDTDSDVDLLSRLFGSHGRLVDILTGLLNERPDSEAWLAAWRECTVEDYVEYLWDHVCELDVATARQFFEEDTVQDAIETAHRFTREEFAVELGADGIDVLREIAEIVDGLDTGDERAYQQACGELYSRLETSSGGLYSSASHHLIGTKASWNDETQAYSECKEALNVLLDRLSAIEDELGTTPGELERNSAHYVLALTRVFEDVLAEYEAEKETREALDFPDLIETTIGFLRTNPEVRTSLRVSFDALMVDEFQDTDGRQWELVSLLAELTEDNVETDNVFLVGDKKQSIYGFRGAEVTTFDRAKDALREQNQALGRDSIPDGTQDSPTDLELSGNFRTLDAPLSFLNELFEAVFQPEGEEYTEYEAEPQELSFERDRIEDVTALNGSVEYLVVPEDEQSATTLVGENHPVTDAAIEHATAAEAEAMGARLSSLLADPPSVYDTDANETRDAKPEDIAILLRRRTHLDRYQRALDAHEVPYSVISGTGFYDAPEVQTLINLLRILADPSDDISLYGVLRSPLFGFTDDRLAPLAATDEALWESLNATEDEQLRDAAELLTHWRELAGCVHSEETEVLPWNRVLTQVFDDTGYLISIGADEGGKQAVANVEKFRDEIREWSEGGTRTAASVLRRIDRQAELDPREGEAEVPEGTDGVRIMTIHAAKGLEFPIVVVPDLGSDLNFGRSVDEYGYVRLITDHDDDPFLAAGGPSPTDAFEVEKTTAHRYADDIELPRERAEAKRLLYVACTRSRDHLLLCGTHEVEETEEGFAFADVNDPEEARAWRDWIQPSLLERDGVIQDLTRTGRFRGTLGDATYTVQLPGEGETWQKEETSTGVSEEQFPSIEIPENPTKEAKRRVSATQLVEAASGYSSDQDASDESEANSSDEGAEDSGSDLPRNEFGTVVHRILEFDRPQSEWSTLARRIAAVNGFDVTESTVNEVVEHAVDANEFLDAEAAAYENSETYEELSVSVDVGNFQIVGDIDHLRVTPEAFVITDYKTNRLGTRTTEELAEHYRPQMMSYALALLEHDPDREIIVNLRFTDASTTESFRWSHADCELLSDELVKIGELSD
ncbi:UvrD-helicase domain-containing protein [Halovenus rubra]|uniref:UvrD-helicase domain-containing protein n=2 Tax=Halovenus rubra TaxID=869890 RepID=A0ACC7E2T7_9EURY|nr:UvrD-helicase domain-containing protein [Halovenus rubra]